MTNEEKVEKLQILLDKVINRTRDYTKEKCQIMRDSRQKHTYTCANCGKKFEAYATVRPDEMRTCSGRCRTRMYVNRKKLNEVTK